MKKMTAIMLTAAMVGTMLSGCGSSAGTETPAAGGENAATTAGGAKTDETKGAGASGKNVTIRFATQSMTDTTAPVLLGILDQFQKDYPNVKLEIEESPGNDLITKINTDIMGDNTPDIFTFWRPESKWNVDKYIEKGAIADLTELVNTDPFFKDLFPDYAWKTATVNDKVYCIPRSNFYIEFLVNKTVFDQYGIELPTDWDKLKEACVKLKENGIIPWCVDTKEGMDDSSRLFNAIINRAVGNEKGLELLKGNESFQQEDVIRALDYFLEVSSGYAPEDGPVLSISQAVEKYLNTGRAGMVLSNCTVIDKCLTDDILKDLVVLDLPLTPVSVIDQPSLEQDLTNLVYISADAYADQDKQEYVVELMKRIVSKEAAKLNVEVERQAVPHLGLDIDPAKVTDLQRQASAIAEKSPGDKWLLSFAKPGPVDNFRIVINESWYGKYKTGAEMAKALDDALYQK